MYAQVCILFYLGMDCLRVNNVQMRCTEAGYVLLSH